MKRIFIGIILSAFLFCGGCALAKTPKVFVMPKGAGTVIVDENSFAVALDFTRTPQTITVKAKESAFDTFYTFKGKEVLLRHDSISATLEVAALPDTNTAGLIYKILMDMQKNKPHRKKENDTYLFYSTVNGVSYSGECDKQGNILSFEVPDYKFYFKAANPKNNE